MDRLWYVAYGSNLCSNRFRVYLEGGLPEGAARDHPGSRNTAAPARREAVLIPGGIRFVATSSVWGGGMAIYDPDADGTVAGRAYLITAEQFVDVLAQEMRTDPGTDVDLAPVYENGWHSIGHGHYQTLAHLGERDGLPMLTFTSGGPADHPVNPPSASYLRTIAAGLREAYGWPAKRIGGYLARFPGAAGVWEPAAIADLVD